jgi:hypothetical protein
LDPSRRYALLTGAVELRSGKKLDPTAITIEPVSGSVPKLDREGRYILAHYGVDLGNNTTIDPRVQINGMDVQIVSGRVGTMPLCYRRSDYAFNCELARSVFTGDNVDVDLVARGTGALVDGSSIRPAAVEIAVPKKREDSQVYLNLAYSRLNDEQKGSATFGIQNLTWMRLGQTSDRVRLLLGPYADVLITTDRDKGRYTGGPQARLLVHQFAGLPLVDVRFVPRWKPTRSSGSGT